MISFYSILSSKCTKVVELQPMSLINVACGLGTFWAHSVSKEVNSGESQWMSFRSSVPVRLRDQYPETGSIPGSSTQKS
jgi:hypothetical protein